MRNMATLLDAVEHQRTKKTFYPTPELLEKFNLFAGMKKNWLPPCYGKKRYQDMAPDEQHVVDSFQGKERYEHIMAHADYYLDTAGARQPLLLGASKEAVVHVD